jgi:sporulation protein YlmC with PRC-barrel domain
LNTIIIVVFLIGNSGEIKTMKVYPKHPKLLSESTLSGNRVISPLEEDLGKIVDLIIDIRPGQVAYAILSFGGVLGVGDRLFAVPWDAMDLNTDKHAFVINVEKDVLKSAPGFEKDNWPDMGNLDWGERIYAYYGQRPYWSTGRDEPLLETGRTGREIGRETVGQPEAPKGFIIPETEATPGSLPPAHVAVEETRPASFISPTGEVRLARGSALKGLKVRNMEGEDLGKINEMMIELEMGKIAYAVLAFGGVLGLASKLFAVPWNALGIDPAKREFLLNIPKKNLEEAPGFDKDNWPGVMSEDWTGSI